MKATTNEFDRRVAPRSAPRPHFEVLDGLRGVAALVVLAGHASALLLGHAIVERKLLAVQFFFMLSGFVVACAYEAKLRAGLSFRDFALRRLIRLYPLIVLGAAIALPMFVKMNVRLLSAPDAALLWAAASLGLPCPDCIAADTMFPIDPPQWSLFFELVAYLIYAALIGWLTTPRLIALTALLSGGAIALMIVYTDHIPFHGHYVTSLAAFGAGVLLWRWRAAHPDAAFRLPTPLMTLALAAACAAPRAWGWGIDVAATLVLFPLLIVAGSSPAAMGRATALDRRLGALSYPLYIVHWPVILLAAGVLRHWLPPVPTAIASSLIAIAAAWLALHLYDIPVRAWLTRRMAATGAGSGNRTRVTSLEG